MSAGYVFRVQGARFLNGPVNLRAREAVEKSQTLSLQSYFIHILLK